MSEHAAFLRLGTPLEDHLQRYGLLVKREDLSCPPPGPPFSKTRGVLGHVKARYDEGVRVFGALDTYHSQAGHAVSAACRYVGAQCLNFFPRFQADISFGAEQPENTMPYGQASWINLREPQLRSAMLGAELIDLQAGRSAILFHQAKKITLERGGYMMPNALKLPETVTETALEVVRTFEQADRATYQRLRTIPWLISASSGTIAAGVVCGLCDMLPVPPPVIIHMGYERPEMAVKTYILDKSGKAGHGVVLNLIQEGYAYKDQAKPGETPEWPCNAWYDLKAFRWWAREGREKYGEAVMWNIG